MRRHGRKTRRASRCTLTGQHGLYLSEACDYGKKEVKETSVENRCKYGVTVAAPEDIDDSGSGSSASSVFPGKIDDAALGLSDFSAMVQGFGSISTIAELSCSDESESVAALACLFQDAEGMKFVKQDIRCVLQNSQLMEKHQNR